MSKFVKIMFGDFCFLQNPEKLTVSRGLKTEKYHYIDSFTKLFITENEPCVVHGEGIIQNEKCDEEFLKIHSLFEAGKPDFLLIFGCPPMTAVISGLKRLTAPGNNYLRYEITFTEIPKRESGFKLECRDFTVASKNQNLWNIAAVNNIKIEKLMELNPDIASPYLIKEGESVRLR